MRFATKHAAALLLLLAPCRPSAAADEAGLADARRLWLGGKYAEAAEIYGPLAAENPAAALGLSRCLEAQGRAGEAVERLTAAADGHADLIAELARLAFDRGDYTTAKARGEEALRLDADQLLARWIQAELDRAAGRLEQAERGYAWLVSYYNDHDVRSAESLHWIGLAAAHYARWNRLGDQFSFLVNDLYPDALKLEPAYWPAHYEAGLLFLEKHNQADAARQFQAALELNPNAAEVYAARARLALDNRDVAEAESSLARALELNPRLLSAWQVKADLAWANFDTAEALRLLGEEALPLNPRDQQTLGRLAACYLLSPASTKPDETAPFDRLLEEVNDDNAHAGEFYYALAVQLAARNKLSQAKSFLLAAIEKMPQLPGPRAELGQVLMRSGEEAEARRWLDEAFGVDPFNVRTGNMLEVLDVLGSMETLETKHFTLRYDPQCDKLLARYAAERLEAIYPQWCRRFGYRPARKPLIEIFSTAKGNSGQSWFSTRLVGLPYLGIVAASTGPLIAMASPCEKPTGHQFNWARVLKHELVHVITLQQTDYNIPHWYTEGMAVLLEGSPRPQAWSELLRDRVAAGHLFNLGTLNFGFTRPQNSGDWLMAYCQSELYVEYMLSRWGPTPLRRLLAAYRDGLETPEAIQRVFGISIERFEAGYVEYLKQLTAGMSAMPGLSSASFEQLLRQHRERPDDADTAAELAYAYLRRGADREARQLADAVLQRQPKHQLATYVVARLLAAQQKTEQAIEMLASCLDLDAPHPLALNLLATLQLKAERYDEAARLYALGARLDPVDLKWTKALARVYLTTGNQQRLAEVLARLAGADVDDIASRKKLAELALARKDYDDAASWANQAMEIDVQDAEVHRLFAEALSGGDNYAKAVEEFEVAAELDPEQPYRLYALADACLMARQPAKARQTLESLLKLAPDYPGARLMMQQTEEIDQDER